MGLFGIGEHGERHDEVERQLRRLVEQVAQLSIDLGVTRTELRRLSLIVDGKVTEADLDPSIVSLNERIKEARVKLAATRASAEETWDGISSELSETIDALSEELDEGDG
jgi:hypothetical protein